MGGVVLQILATLQIIIVPNNMTMKNGFNRKHVMFFFFFTFF